MILNEILDIQNKDVKNPYFATPTNEKKDEREYTFSFIINGLFINANNMRYNIVQRMNPEIGQQLMQILYSNRNIYMNHTLKSDILADFLNRNQYGDDELLTQIYKYTNMIHQYLPNQKYYYQKISGSNILFHYMYQYIWEYYRNRNINYIIENKNKIKLNIKNIEKFKYGIAKIPKELFYKFNRIEENINEVKDLLKLNKDIGYYVYIINNIEIPVLCKHVFMTITGINPADISIECYSDGRCKYCGQNMIDYNDRMTDTLSLPVISLIYKFISTISENMDISSLYFSLYDMIYKSINRNKINKNDDNMILAFTSLFLLKIYLEVKSYIKWNKSKLSKFTDTITLYTSIVGWDKDKIDNNINNEEIFGDFSGIKNLVLSKIYNAENDKHTESYLYNVLFGINDTKVSNTFQKIYEKGFEKVEIYNSLYIKLLLSYWKFPDLIGMLKLFKGKESYYEFLKLIITKSTTGEQFFNIMCQYYCPVNNIHVWKSNKCEYCSLNKDLSNEHEIYIKYSEIINQNIVEFPKILNFNGKEADEKNSEEILKKIKNTDDSKLFELLDINNVNLIEKINSLADISKVIDFISTITCLSLNKIEKDVSFIKKSMQYIINEKLLEPKELRSRIDFLYNPKTNIDLLLM